jgi:hypothetical protein
VYADEEVPTRLRANCGLHPQWQTQQRLHRLEVPANSLTTSPIGRDRSGTTMSGTKVSSFIRAHLATAPREERGNRRCAPACRELPYPRLSVILRCFVRKRGTFAATFFLAALVAIGCEAVTLEDI